jgi:hypothetical protein
MTFGQRAFSFLTGIRPSFKLPKGVDVLLPFMSAEAIDVNKEFFEKYYSDNRPRRLIIGINPGRFGAGVTGIAFTDPIRLERELGITNSFPKKPELSSDFIYRMINAYGGTMKFYSDFYLTAICPVGFVKDGKNLNYYDLPELENAARPFIIESINEHLEFGVDREKAFCLGEGKNYKFLSKLNSEHNFFKEIIPLAHPRFIMQYKRKFLEDYISKYIDALSY